MKQTLITLILVALGVAGFSQVDNLEQAKLDSIAQSLLLERQVNVAKTLHVGLKKVDIPKDSIQVFIGRYNEKMYIITFDNVYEMPSSYLRMNIAPERLSLVKNLGIPGNHIDMDYDPNTETIKVMDVPFPNTPVNLPLPSY